MRDFQDDKCDVINKYTPDESRNLKAYGEIPEEAKINEDEHFNEDGTDCPFEFGEPDELEIVNQEDEESIVDLDEI